MIRFLSLALLVGCIYETRPHAGREGFPPSPRGNMERCADMLAEYFPDDPAGSWTILECGGAGVIARDPQRFDYAITPDGSLWEVSASGAWDLIANGEACP